MPPPLAAAVFRVKRSPVSVAYQSWSTAPPRVAWLAVKTLSVALRPS
jgi:hypothetical protein